MQKLRDLNNLGKLSFHISPRLNTWLDQSSNSNDATVQNGSYSQGLQGRGYVKYDTTAGAHIPDDTSLQNTSGYLGVTFAHPAVNVSGSSRLISKRDGGGTQYEFYLGNGQINIFDGTAVRTVSIDYSGARSIIVKLDGANSKAFLNGEDVGAFSSSPVITADDADIYLSSFYNGGFDQVNAVCDYFGINDASISEDDIAAIHEEFMQSRGATLTTIRNPIAQIPLKTDDSVGFWSADNITADNLIYDTAGSNPITLSNLGNTRDQYNCFSFLGSPTSYSASNSSPTGLPEGGSARTIEALVWFDSFNPGDGVSIIDYGNESGAGQDCVVQYKNIVGGIFTDGVNAGNNIFPNVAPPLQSWCHFVFTIENDEYVCKINNQTVRSGSFIAAINTVTPTSLNVMWRNRTLAIERSYCQNSKVAFVNIIDFAWTDAQIESRYKSLNKLIKYKELPENQPPTTSVVTAGNPIPFGDWKNISGNITVGEEDGSKYYKTSSASMQMYLDLPNGYGTYIFEYEKGDGEQLEFLIAANQATVRTAGGFNAYLIALQTNESYGLYSVTSGSAASIQQGTAGEITVGAKQKCAITRDRGGNFKIYHFNGTSWSEVISATNNTFTTAGKITYEVRAGNSENSFNGLTYYPMPLTIDQLN